MPDDNTLPDQIVESIAISNAKSIGEQPAILANLALSNQILNNNMQQQMMIAQQQAMNQITMATLSKCVSLITQDESQGPEEAQKLETMLDNLKKQFEEMTKPFGSGSMQTGGQPSQPPK